MQEFRPQRSAVEASVAGCRMFDAITGDVRERFVDVFDGVRLVTGEVLMAEGEPADSLYLVRHGRLRATVATPDGGQVEIGQVGKSEVVGEMALITDAPRSATVTAMRDSELYRLPAEAFVEITVDHPEVYRPFAGVVVERLRRAITGGQRSTLPATVVLIPAPGVSIDVLAATMAECVTSYRAVVVGPDDATGRDDPAAWLLEIENAFDIVVLVADAGPTDWTRQCLRHADRALLVVDEASDPAPTPVESDPVCARRIAEIPLHLVARYRSAPTSSRWYPGRDIVAHHNIELADDEAPRPGHIERLIRRLTGDATVLVLGGGGARGFAHLGVIRGLLDAGVGIDAVVGTSAGALVGGLLARYGEIDEHQDALLAWFDDVRWRRDVTPPTVALLTGRLMTEGFHEMYGDRAIEDLTIDYAAVSTDLCAAAPKVHTSGPLWRAVRASTAVPGIFPPVAVGGTVLVDGGLAANLPVDIARGRHQDAHIIAVDVGDRRSFEAGGLDDTGIASGWQHLRRGSTAPSLPKVLMRLTELGRNDDASGADVVIRPRLDGFGLTETSAMHTIVARGREAVDAALADGSLTRR